MDVEIFNLFDNLSFPVLITDHRDILLYKNTIGRKYFSVPRKGSSVKPSISPFGINIIDDADHTSEIHTFKNPDSAYNRAIVLKYGRGTSAIKVWIFDITLQMIKPEMARTFLYNAARLIYPMISEIIEKKADAESVFGDSWSTPLYKLSIMLNNCLRKLFFVNAHEYCSADELCKTLCSEIFKKLAAFGVSCRGHRFSHVTEPTYVDYYNYTMLFIRIFLMVIHRNKGSVIDVNFTRDIGVLRTEITFAADIKMPRNSKSGGINTFHYAFDRDSLNIALIDSIMKIDGRSRFSYEIRTWDMKNTTLAFDFPAKTQPGRRLRQSVSISDIDYTEFTELIVGFIRNI